MNEIKVCVDRLLPTRKARMEAARLSVIENPDNAPVYDLKDKLSLALETERRWAIGRTLSVYFMEGSSTQKRRVEERFRIIEQYANVKFKVVEDPKSDIRIGFDANEGSWSYVGTDSLTVPSKERTMNFGWLEDDTEDKEYDRTACHEVLHSLGMTHEHNSPAANIKWNKPAVYAYFKGPPNYWTRADVDNNLFYKYDDKLTQYSEFDPLSIMIYSIPSTFTTDGFSVPWNTSLSAIDKKYLGLFYPFTDIKLDGTPRLLTFPADTLKKLDLVVNEVEAGKYEVWAEPELGTWLSIISSNGSKIYGKDRLNLDLSAGKSIMKVRNTKIGGKFKVYVRPIE